MANKSRQLTFAAAIAALYVALSLICGALGLASGAVQIRLSEALCILPVYSAYAVSGLFCGCLITNLILSGSVIDVIFGSIATLIGALLTRVIGKRHKILAICAPIASNTVIIPFVLKYAYGIEDAVILLALGIFVGEVVSCGFFGMLLDRMLGAYPQLLKLIENETER